MTGTNKMSPGTFVDGTLVVARRELSATFDTPIAYVYTIAFALLANSIFMNEFFLTGTVDMGSFFGVLPLLLAFFVPAITMRLWAEERKQRTIEFLLTLPILPAQAILGKFLASLGLIGVLAATSFPIPIMLAVLGEPDLGLIASGYLGFVLLGSLLLAVGMLASALSTDQIVSFVAATLGGFLLVLSGDPRVVAVLDGVSPGLALGTNLADSFSALPHFEDLARGVIELSALIYFIALPAALLWTTSLVLERNRS